MRRFVETYSRPSLSWDDLAFLRERTRLPILLKGVLHPADAVTAIEHGMDGVVVSNHGGRQVDGAIATMDALPGIVEAVAGRVPVVARQRRALRRRRLPRARARRRGGRARPALRVGARGGRRGGRARGHPEPPSGLRPDDGARRMRCRDRHRADSVSARAERGPCLSTRIARAARPLSDRRERRHRRRGRPEARAHGRVARRALPRPPLVGFAISREAAMHELLREAGGCAISLLAAGQDWLAQHFARGVPPIAMWHGIATEPGASGAPLLVGALGWLECAIRDEVATGTHTFFVCDVRRVELGVDAPGLLRVRGAYGET